jgi:ribosomal protein L7/L12/DNA-binding beta-propeller fold protein YncE
MTEAQLFHCPSCGAPLDIQPGRRSLRCPYCNNSVIVPQSLREEQEDEQQVLLGDVRLLAANHKKIEAIKLLRQLTNLGLKEAKELVEAMERGEQVGPIIFTQAADVQPGWQVNAGTLDQDALLDLLQRGQKIEAIRQVREATGLGLKESKDAVEALERGDRMAIVKAVTGSAFGRLEGSLSGAAVSSTVTPLSPRQTRQVAKAVGAGAGCTGMVILGITLAAILIPLLVVLTVNGGPLMAIWSKINPLGYAAMDMTVKGEGIAPGQFNDPRAIAADEQGNIYVADYSTGRLQSLDAQGQFRWLVNLGEDVIVQSMDVSPGGVLFVVAKGEIRRFQPEDGVELEPLADPQDEYYFDDLAIGPDGRLAVIADGEHLLVYNANLQPVISVPAAVSTAANDSELDSDVAIDSLGNIYILGHFTNKVFIYSPEGRFMSQFGGDTTDETPGKFRAPGDIAVDGEGRIYVSDIFGVQVFSSDGQYLDKFKLFQYAHGMDFDLQNRMYVASNEPQVMRLTVK